MRPKSNTKPPKKQIPTLNIDDDEPYVSEYEWINDLDKNFRQNIRNKIAIIETLSKKGEPQRCMGHNIPYSLYCTLCRKVICASCMYNYSTHKNHKVIPVQLANKEMREDIEAVHGKVEVKLKVYREIINDINSRTIQTNQVFNKTTNALNRFYQSLHESLKNKQKEQLKTLSMKQKDALHEYKVFFQKISELQIYLNEKFETYANSKVKNELLVPSKSILQIINLNVSQSQFYDSELDKHRFKLSLDHLKEVQDQIILKVDLIDKNNINSNIKTMEKKLNSPRAVSPYAISKQKKTPLKINNNAKMNSNFSVIASPRSVRGHSPR